MDNIWLWLAGLLLVATLMWLKQRSSGNAGWVDVFWAWGTGVTGSAFLLLGNGELLPRLAALVLLACWSVRLGGHIFRRVGQEDHEDGRYAAMRAALGKKTQTVFLFFFWSQALLAWGFALTFKVIGEQAQWSTWSVVTGALIGLLAIAGEGLADTQLSRFKANPANRGKTCREGLWRYSRHPNYFFEWLHWLSYPLIALGASNAGWLWLLPLAMFLFLWFVTGIPYTEKQAIKSRGDDYREYQRTTSAFFPWRPTS